jgi:hypothetical protein
VATFNNEQIWNEIETQISTPTNPKNHYLALGTKNFSRSMLNESLYDTNSDQGLPIGTHAYMIDSIDTINKTVTLLNPHGIDHVLLPFSELSKVVNSIYFLNKP